MVARLQQRNDIPWRWRRRQNFNLIVCTVSITSCKRTSPTTENVEFIRSAQIIVISESEQELHQLTGWFPRGSANVDENQSVIWPMMISFVRNPLPAATNHREIARCELHLIHFISEWLLVLRPFAQTQPLHEHILISPWNCGTTKRCR